MDDSQALREPRHQFERDLIGNITANIRDNFRIYFVDTDYDRYFAIFYDHIFQDYLMRFVPRWEDALNDDFVRGLQPTYVGRCLA
ncbi:hypothetical protein C482_04079 [Natrialba chahannaoensis JCM 10990]|uniref:Uncharacterized protein n=1 Tax=Natrialba chahannaoensis JCM 10990 TaxID=1227492 RepID=M0AYW4_9EURY|nr:hypothetical protein C482_04079 [Natrialba chahannaoensis JCM 10990]